MRYFFTSDTHFFHRGIIKHCNRPFKNPEQMNDAMIAIWNRQVSKNDIVYHLGDFSFGGLAETFRVLAELKGTICLISGNHDDMILGDDQLRKRFSSINPYLETVIDNQEVVLSHYPILQWRNAQRGAWLLYGHTHGSITLRGPALDVGIDGHPEFRLWEWGEIKNALQNKAALPYPKKPRYPKRVFSDDYQLISVDGKTAH